MINNLTSCKTFASQIVAEYTLKALRRTVPTAVPAIFFLSGGQTDEESVLNLNAINAYHDEKPWRLSFCYGRALQVCIVIYVIKIMFIAFFAYKFFVKFKNFSDADKKIITQTIKKSNKENVHICARTQLYISEICYLFCYRIQR